MDWSKYSEEVQELVAFLGNMSPERIPLVPEKAGRLLEIGTQMNDIALLGFSNSYLAAYGVFSNNMKDLFSYAMAGEDYLIQSKQWDLLVYQYNYLANASLQQENAIAALDYYLKGIDICENKAEKDSLKKMQLVLQGNIGITYLMYEQYEQGLVYVKRSMELLESLPVEEWEQDILTVFYIALLRCFTGMHRLDEAADCLKTAKEDKRQEPTPLMQLCFLCTEVIFHEESGDMEQMDACIREIEKSLDIHLVLHGCFEDLYRYCQLLMRQNRMEELWHTISVIEEEVKRSDLVRSRKKTQELKIEYFKRTGEREKLLEAAEQYYEASCQDDKNAQDILAGMLEVRFSLEKSRKKEEQLQRQSYTDALTGIPNRAWFKEETPTILKRARKQKQYFGVEILDVDYFKEFNDNYGHQMGDFCLSSVAGALKRLAEHPGVYPARYGGDEFIVIYEGHSPEEVKRLTEELKNDIVGMAIEHKYSKAFPIVTVSQGACCDMPQEDETYENYLHDADEMLYQVKRRSRNAADVCMRTRE